MRLWNMEKLKREELSPAFISMEMLLMLESKLSPLMKFIIIAH